MKEQLIELAKEKGFESKAIIFQYGANPAKLTIQEAEFSYYLWMCELQKWLRDSHNIIVTFEISGAGIYPDIITFDKKPFKITTIDYSCSIDMMDICLEKGLYEALKLIK